jgi:hypothetical protein
MLKRDPVVSVSRFTLQSYEFSIELFGRRGTIAWGGASRLNLSYSTCSSANASRNEGPRGFEPLEGLINPLRDGTAPFIGQLKNTRLL